MKKSIKLVFAKIVLFLVLQPIIFGAVANENCLTEWEYDLNWKHYKKLPVLANKIPEVNEEASKKLINFFKGTHLSRSYAEDLRVDSSGVIYYPPLEIRFFVKKEKDGRPKIVYSKPECDAVLGRFGCWRNSYYEIPELIEIFKDFLVDIYYKTIKKYKEEYPKLAESLSDEEVYELSNITKTIDQMKNKDYEALLKLSDTMRLYPNLTHSIFDYEDVFCNLMLAMAWYMQLPQNIIDYIISRSDRYADLNCGPPLIYQNIVQYSFNQDSQDNRKKAYDEYVKYIPKFYEESKSVDANLSDLSELAVCIQDRITDQEYKDKAILDFISYIEHYDNRDLWKSGFIAIAIYKLKLIKDKRDDEEMLQKIDKTIEKLEGFKLFSEQRGQISTYNNRNVVVC